MTRKIIKEMNSIKLTYTAPSVLDYGLELEGFICVSVPTEVEGLRSDYGGGLIFGEDTEDETDY